VALRLTVISEQRGSLGRNASIVLGVGGGSIGRAHDNDWVLPDAHCYVSAHHARVQFRSGSYYLLDTSTNGVYVNGANAPINSRSLYPLRNGDYLRFGEYQIAVSIDADSAEAPEASSIFPIGASTHSAGSEQPDIGVDFDVQALLQTAAGLSVSGNGASARPGSPITALSSGGSAAQAAHSAQAAQAAPVTPGRFAVDSFGQAINPAEPPYAMPARGVRSAALAPATISATPEVAAAARLRRESRGAPVEPTGRHRTLGTVPIEQAALEAFCRGAGLEARRLPPEAHSRLLYLAGLLLREALAGLKGLALAQRELRDQARLSVGREDPQHIGLTGLPVEDLMLRLLLGHDRHDLDAVQWLRDLAANTRGYELALMRALPAALAEFIARLDPRALSHQDTEAASEAHVDATGVTARFRSITESSPGALPQLFVEALAHAFAAEFARGRDHPRS
jgi:type VI secretion system protein